MNKNIKKYLSGIPRKIKALYESNAHWAEIKLFEYWKASGVVTEMVNQIKTPLLNSLTDRNNRQLSSFTFNLGVNRRFSVLIDIKFIHNQLLNVFFIEGFRDEELTNIRADCIGTFTIIIDPNETDKIKDKKLTLFLRHELMHVFQCYMIRRAHLSNKEINKNTRALLIGGDSYNSTKIYYEMLNLLNKGENNAIIGLLFNLFHKTLSSEIVAAKQEFNIELNYITEDQTLEDVQVFKDFVSIPLKQIEIARNRFQDDFEMVQVPFPIPYDLRGSINYYDRDFKALIKEYEAIWNIGKDYTWKDHLNLIESKIKENEVKFRESFLMNVFNSK